MPAVQVPFELKELLAELPQGEVVDCGPGRLPLRRRTEAQVHIELLR